MKRRNMPGQFDWGPAARLLARPDGDGLDGRRRHAPAHGYQGAHPNIVGDTNTIYGQVISKRVEDGQHLVELDIRNENQAGLVTALSRVTVALPSRN